MIAGGGRLDLIEHTLIVHTRGEPRAWGPLGPPEFQRLGSGTRPRLYFHSQRAGVLDVPQMLGRGTQPSTSDTLISPRKGSFMSHQQPKVNRQALCFELSASKQPIHLFSQGARTKANTRSLTRPYNSIFSPLVRSLEFAKD